jgi:hypothetical protein
MCTCLCQVVGYVRIGKGVTMMPTSIASHGTVVPDGYIMTPGTTSQRLPPGPSGGHGGCNGCIMQYVCQYHGVSCVKQLAASYRPCRPCSAGMQHVCQYHGILSRASGSMCLFHSSCHLLCKHHKMRKPLAGCIGPMHLSAGTADLALAPRLMTIKCVSRCWYCCFCLNRCRSSCACAQ